MLAGVSPEGGYLLYAMLCMLCYVCYAPNSININAPTQAGQLREDSLPQRSTPPVPGAVPSCPMVPVSLTRRALGGPSFSVRSSLPWLVAEPVTKFCRWLLGMAQILYPGTFLCHTLSISFSSMPVSSPRCSIAHQAIRAVVESKCHIDPRLYLTSLFRSSHPRHRSWVYAS